MAIPVILPGSRRLGLLILAAAVVVAIPIIKPFAEIYVGSHSAALKTQLLHRLVLPAPLIFFPVTGIAAMLGGITSEYLKNTRLRDRIYGIVDSIQRFRLKKDANRPILERHPSTGQIGVWRRRECWPTRIESAQLTYPSLDIHLAN
jgi:hypothetical protein